MKIVVLDGKTLNPGDLSWDGLEALGECEIYDRTTKRDILNRSKDAQILIINKVVFDRQVITSLDDLKYIGVMATGYNIVDVTAARERNIVVTNVPTYGTPSVAQMVFALLLELTQHVGHHSETVRQGRWCECEDFCYWDYPLVELAGMVMGIVGFGRIGKEVANLARALGMKVLVYDVNADQLADAEVEAVGLEKLFAASDVVSLHCPLTKETENLVDAGRLELMKKTALLINTSRGQLVNDRDLAEALNTGRLAGAGLDVLSTEPPTADNPLLNAKNCYITPHIAWATRSARKRLLLTVVDNVKAFLAGKPRNVVN